MQRLKYLGKVCPFIDLENRYERWLPGEEKDVSEGHAERLLSTHTQFFARTAQHKVEEPASDKMAPAGRNKMARPTRNKASQED